MLHDRRDLDRNLLRDILAKWVVKWAANPRRYCADCSHKNSNKPRSVLAWCRDCSALICIYYPPFYQPTVLDFPRTPTNQADPAARRGRSLLRGRGAQGRSDQGWRCLSPQGEFSQTPMGLSTTGQPAGPTRQGRSRRAAGSKRRAQTLTPRPSRFELRSKTPAPLQQPCPSAALPATG